jgi:hypothetical protein
MGGKRAIISFSFQFPHFADVVLARDSAAAAFTEASASHRLWRQRDSSDDFC